MLCLKGSKEALAKQRAIGVPELCDDDSDDEDDDDDDDDDGEVPVLLAHQYLPSSIKCSNGSGSLKKHLKNMHNIVIQNAKIEVRNTSVEKSIKQNAVGSIERGFGKLALRIDNFKRSCVRFVVENHIPFSALKSEQFVEMIRLSTQLPENAVKPIQHHDVIKLIFETFEEFVEFTKKRLRLLVMYTVARF